MWFWLCLAAYGFQAFNLTMASDDWIFLFHPPEDDYTGVRNGRWCQDIWWILFENPGFAPPVTLFILCVSLAASGLIFSNLLRIRQRFSVFVFVSVFMLFPMWIEHVNYKVQHTVIGMTVLLSALLAYLLIATLNQLEKKTPWPRVLVLAAASAFTLSVVASFYQTFIFFSVSAYLLFVYQRIYHAEPAAPFKFFMRSLLLLAGICAVGLALYSAEVVLSRQLMVPPGMPRIRESAEYQIMGSLVRGKGSFFVAIETTASYIFSYLFEIPEPDPILPRMRRIRTIV